MENWEQHDSFICIVICFYVFVDYWNFTIRCAVTAVHEAMLTAPKLKLAQYKLHNPVFEDNLILSNNLEKKQVSNELWFAIIVPN